MSETTLTVIVFLGGCALVALVMWFGVCAMDCFERVFFGDAE